MAFFQAGSERDIFKMKVTLISTLLNEIDHLDEWLNSIFAQTRRPDEVIIVDAGSSDGTYEKLIEWQKNFPELIVKQKCGANIAEGRNLAISAASNELIAVTDSGCVLARDWLEHMIDPFQETMVDVVSGCYIPVGKGILGSLAASYLKMDRLNMDPETFLPSSRSIAFRRSSWRAVQGYPEWLYRTGEDTLFDVELRKRSFRFFSQPAAKVYWRVPGNLKGFCKQAFEYARGDREAGLFYTAYIKMSCKYLLGFLLLISWVLSQSLWALLMFMVWMLYVLGKVAKEILPKAAMPIEFAGLIPIALLYQLAGVFGFIFSRYRISPPQKQTTKMIYLMHVPWKWIKQRPHFLAQYLARYFDLCVGCLASLKTSNLVVNPYQYLNIHVLHKLPFSSVRLISLINSWLLTWQIKRLLKGAKFVWLTHPLFWPLLSSKLSTGQKIIYDCCDDVLEFPKAKRSPELSGVLLAQERELVQKCDRLIVSSEHLKEVLAKRYGLLKNVQVVNNAIELEPQTNSELVLPPRMTKALSDRRFKLVYIGTISEWFDFELMGRLLERFSDLVILLFGPMEVMPIQHERLLYMGPVEHCHIYSIMDRSDALIMPFKTSELVLSVNPVKLYEYIYSGKPSIAVRYPESEKFSDFVYLYNNFDDLCKLINKLRANQLGPKTDLLQCKAFARNNDWMSRAEHLQRLVLGHKV
jgi:glycosyltransferase involved in cell wall biosynthesis